LSTRFYVKLGTCCVCALATPLLPSVHGRGNKAETGVSGLHTHVRVYAQGYMRINVDNVHKLVDRKSITTTNEGVANAKKFGSYLILARGIWAQDQVKSVLSLQQGKQHFTQLSFQVRTAMNSDTAWRCKWVRTVSRNILATSSRPTLKTTASCFLETFALKTTHGVTTQ
jgi:hypothetical protein